MASALFSITAAVLLAASVVHASNADESPYDTYGPCEPLNKYNISSFNINVVSHVQKNLFFIKL